MQYFPRETCCFSYKKHSVLNTKSTFTQSFPMLWSDTFTACVYGSFNLSFFWFNTIVEFCDLISSWRRKLSLPSVLVIPTSGDALCCGRLVSTLYGGIWLSSMCVCLIIPEETCEHQGQGWGVSLAIVQTLNIATKLHPVVLCNHAGFLLALSCAKV